MSCRRSCERNQERLEWCQRQSRHSQPHHRPHRREIRDRYHEASCLRDHFDIVDKLTLNVMHNVHKQVAHDTAALSRSIRRLHQGGTFRTPSTSCKSFYVSWNGRPCPKLSDHMIICSRSMLADRVCCASVARCRGKLRHSERQMAMCR